MPTCLESFWETKRDDLKAAILAARPAGLAPPPPNHQWAVNLDTDAAYDILRVVRDALDSSIGNAPAPPPPPRNPAGTLPSGNIVQCANAFIAKFNDDRLDRGGRCHQQGDNWLRTPAPVPTPPKPPPGPPTLSHQPIPQPEAIAAVDDLLRVVRDALDPT